MFKDMHNMEEPLILCNVWDASSAKLAESIGFLAIGTSSAAIATNLGLEDGENICFEELLMTVRTIVNSTHLPLTVDIEAGYGETPEAIVNNITKLVKLGVVGINIEDSNVVGKSRKLQDEVLFSEKLKEVKRRLIESGIDVFINVRSDVFLLNIENPVLSSINRIKRYQRAGADGIFLPCLVDSDDIKAIVASTSLPVNVMCLPELPCFEKLKTLGIRRISMGNFAHKVMLTALSSTLKTVKKEGSSKGLFT
ncbi:isocitrate lyase/PEP mutase family protein [Vibrio caribbeanicus]|uniref:Carboxyvinyl-carboxyphosphonate phosphorylmutase n=1 Tax=Vibrio caribbeanicus ATCC BAA-2122 TaxID=796620 RepID=E3BQN5_9VIBR|nr:isocitrate lyase/phosphoenolpyruvate mutase family protein [Vibrio caribbeanicus]EFP94621.1 hypothetical protein VIBC2010_16389 [Vibrio caribbeanicus ATCC BAA-2122]